MRWIRNVFAILAALSVVVFLTGLRPKLEQSNQIDTLLGSMELPEGFEKKVSSGGRTRLETEDGVVVVLDALSAERVAEGGYTKDTVRPILAKAFEPKMVKDPEIEDGAMLFRGFGSVDETTVAFTMSLIDLPSGGAGMVLVFGPNSRRDELAEVAEGIVIDLLT